MRGALTYIDYDVAQVQRWPVKNSPLGVLLDPSRDIGRYAKVVPTGNDRVVSVEARDAAHPEYGRIHVGVRARCGGAGGAGVARLGAARQPGESHHLAAVGSALRRTRCGVGFSLDRSRGARPVVGKGRINPDITISLMCATGWNARGGSGGGAAPGFPPCYPVSNPPACVTNAQVGPRSKPPERGPFCVRRTRDSGAAFARRHSTGGGSASPNPSDVPTRALPRRPLHHRASRGGPPPQASLGGQGSPSRPTSPA